MAFYSIGIDLPVNQRAGRRKKVPPAGRLTVLADFDHDGLPDIWETNHVGLSTNNAADALRGDDGDRTRNRDEYIAGTDYLNAASYLKLQTVGPGIGQLQFTAVSNRTYTVQFTDSLSPPIW